MRWTCFFPLIVLCTSGCLCLVTSIDPLFTDDKVSEAGLVGTWVWRDPVFGDEASGVTFSEATGSKLEVLQKNNQGEAKFVGLVGRLGGDLYLDLSPVNEGVPPAHLWLHSVTTHSIYKVELTEKTLILKPIDGRVVLKLSNREEASIRVKQFEDGRCVLLGSTKEFQNFVATHGAKLFMDPAETYRRAN